MADSKTILQKYVSDMVALETHIEQAIDKQVKENKDNPELSGKYEKFAAVLKQHVAALTDRLTQLGGAANSPVKTTVAAVAGVAAGLVDKVRSEEVSKEFRDDYTALNLSLISYQMLHTTAIALNDQATADLAARNVKDNADFVMEIQRLIPAVVVSELKKNNPELVSTLNEQGADATQKLIDSIWK